jgi:hypothetical protein
VAMSYTPVRRAFVLPGRFDFHGAANYWTYAPSWLWTSIVDLIGAHEMAF